MKRYSRVAATVLFILLAFLAAGPVLAQEPDAEDCRDHPLLSRMKNFYIHDCRKAFDAVEFYLPEGDTETVEGDMTEIGYTLQEGSAQPSVLQVRRNYGNAVKSLGGTILLDEDNDLTARLVKNGRTIWVALRVYNGGRDYTLIVLEVAAMEQEVTADAMYDALTKDGFMAIYINFDTGKADLKPESGPIVAEIASLLEAHDDLRIGIEGHTDNVGTPQGNKALSEARARAVLAAVAAAGADAARMTAVGWGQEKPIADNRTEEGRAKNRRVEIVKK